LKIDNDLGRMKLDRHPLHRQPARAHSRGPVDVHTGTIDVAEVLMQATNNGAYSTTATEIAPADSANEAPAGGVASLFDRLNPYIALRIPSNLVLNGNNIRPASPD
jgi:hypothetical protein